MSFEKLDAKAAMAEEMLEAGVINGELATRYRSKVRAFKKATEEQTEWLSQYTDVRADAILDDVDRQFVAERIKTVLLAARELDAVSREIGELAQAAYVESLKTESE